MNWWLILGPPIGVLVVVLIVAAAGGTRRVRLDAALVCRRAAEDIPGFVAGDCLIGDDGNSALVADGASQAIAVGYAMGARIAVRKIGAGELRAWRVEPQAVKLDVDDFARPEFHVALAGGLGEMWRQRLSALQSTGQPA